MYDTILLPTDGSTNVQLASERAMGLAANFNAVLHVLYVVEKSRDDPVQKGLKEKLGEEMKRGKCIVEAVESKATTQNIDTESVIESGF